MAVSPAVTKMRDLLLKSSLVDEFQLRAAMGRLEQWGGRLPKVLADLGMVNEERVAQMLAASLRLPVQLLGTVPRDAQALARLDVRFCEQHAIFPVSLNAKSHTLVLAMADPTALDVVDLVAARVNARVQVVVSTESQIQAAIARHYRGAEPPTTTPPGAGRATPRRGPVSGGLELELELELDTELPEPRRPAREEVLAMRAPSTNTLLDEMLGDAEVSPEFSPEAQARLAALQANQQRTASALQAMEELLREKGYLR
jgi:hypothetical protein